jgi:hypothetical protein
MFLMISDGGERRRGEERGGEEWRRSTRINTEQGSKGASKLILIWSIVR